MEKTKKPATKVVSSKAQATKAKKVTLTNKLPEDTRNYKSRIISKRKKIGAPTRYRHEYAQMLIDYFSEDYIDYIKKETVSAKGVKTVELIAVAKPLRFISDFAYDVAHTTLKVVEDWVKAYRDFGVAYRRAKELQKKQLINCALKGLYNAQFAQFTAINITDMRAKIELSGKDGDPLVLLLDTVANNNNNRLAKPMADQAITAPPENTTLDVPASTTSQD